MPPAHLETAPIEMNKTNQRASNRSPQSRGGSAALGWPGNRISSGVPGEKRPQFFEEGSKGVRRSFEGVSKHYECITLPPRHQHATRTTPSPCQQGSL